MAQTGDTALLPGRNISKTLWGGVRETFHIWELVSGNSVRVNFA